MSFRIRLLGVLLLSCFAAQAWAGRTQHHNDHDTRPWSSRDNKNGCGCGSSKGMPVYSFTSMLAGLTLQDTPLTYTPPIGPKVDISLTYNSRESSQPDTFDSFNFGRKWSFSWFSYIQDDPARPGHEVKRYVAGGGAVLYPGYDASTGEFDPQRHKGAVLVRTSGHPITYELRFSDGGKAIFSEPNGQTSYPRRVYLTARVDPRGNKVTLHYDGKHRLSYLVDALGQKTTFQYHNTDHPLEVTGVTGPFGRRVSFGYDDQGRLVAITDVMGLQSTFSYAGSDSFFINGMTTPYGTTTFAQTKGKGSRTELSIQATDPMGYTERTEYRHNAPGIAYSATSVPDGMGLRDAYLNYRNSFYWDKSDFADACTFSTDGTSQCDYTQARIKHFLHNSRASSQTAGILESVKYPLEGRIWYRYPGQGSSLMTGSMDTPNEVGRVLSDGATQLTHYSYNERGKITRKVDPAGRVTVYTYAANGIDLVQVQRKTADGLKTLASYTYNSQHEPLSYTNAAGKKTIYGYNARGQRIAVTDPLGHTTNYTYDKNGYLTTITNTLGHVEQRLTHDAKGRIASVTDSEGYTLRYQYDGLNRIVKINYPDGTSRRFQWNRLDLVAVTDREGHTTHYKYDADRRLVAKTDPMGNVTRYGYYPNGKLKTLTDPNGNVTTWKRDLEGRVVAKTYNNGRGDAFTYDNASRLIGKTDALAQTTHYQYAIDDRLTGVHYSNVVNATPAVDFGYGDFFPRLVRMTDGQGTTQYQYYAVGVPGAGHRKRIHGPGAHDQLAYTYDGLGRVVTRTVDGSTETFTYDPLGRVIEDDNVLGDFTNRYLGDTGRLAKRTAAGSPYQVVHRYENNLNDRRLKAILNQTVTRSHHGGFWWWLFGFGKQKTVNSVADFHFTTNADGLITSRKVTGVPAQHHHHHHGWHHGRHHEGHGWGLFGRFDFSNLGWHRWPGHGGWSHHRGHGNTSHYSYDADHRLLGSYGREYSRYQYDPAGNLVSLRSGGHHTTLMPNGLNQVARTDKADYRYDANGNLIDDGQRTYTWDAADRLLTVTEKATDHVTTFAYDGFSRRIKRTETDADGTTITVHNLWCGLRLCEQRDAGGNAIARYFTEGQMKNGEPYYYARDQIGSVVAMVDPDGEVAGRTRYGPYGRIKYQTGVQPNFAYASLYRHQATGLYLATFRAYDPSNGRWLSRDHIREAGGINLYRYVRSDPFNFLDPLGMAGSQNAREGIDALKTIAKELEIGASKGDFPAGIVDTSYNLGKVSTGILKDNLAGGKTSWKIYKLTGISPATFTAYVNYPINWNLVNWHEITSPTGSYFDALHAMLEWTEGKMTNRNDQCK